MGACLRRLLPVIADHLIQQGKSRKARVHIKKCEQCYRKLNNKTCLEKIKKLKGAL